MINLKMMKSNISQIVILQHINRTDKNPVHVTFYSDHLTIFSAWELYLNFYTKHKQTAEQLGHPKCAVIDLLQGKKAMNVRWVNISGGYKDTM